MYSGSLVRLRHQSLADQTIFADFLNKEHIMEIRGYEMPRFTYKEKLEKEYKERFERHHDSSLHLTIETLDGKVIGAIGINFVFWKNSFAYMYQYIGDESYLLGGYREEAIKLFLEFAFIEANIRKLKISAQENDPQSLKALMENGFEIELTHKEDVLCHGKYVDVHELAIFKEDYNN